MNDLITPDSRLSQEIMELLRTITAELSTATLVVSHDKSHLRYADQVVSVLDGKVLGKDDKYINF